MNRFVEFGFEIVVGHAHAHRFAFAPDRTAQLRTAEAQVGVLFARQHRLGEGDIIEHRVDAARLQIENGVCRRGVFPHLGVAFEVFIDKGGINGAGGDADGFAF